MLIPLLFKVMDKLAKEPGFICFPTNLKLIEEEGGGGLFEGSAYLMFGFAGGRGRLFEEIRYSPI